MGAAIAERHSRGAHFAAATQDAVVVAEELRRRFGLPRWRFANSGTEATMTAVRIARGHTSRDHVLRIAGGYHGHHDVAMAGASAGVSRSLAHEVHSVEFNDAGGLERRIVELAAEGHEPACVLIEPVMTGIGLVLPEPGYLEAVRELTQRHHVVLIFDEVKTGLTIARGGATERFGVQPDMVALAKALGAGLPSGAIGMTEELAALVADGRVPQFGTFNANPLGMAAARVNLLEILIPEAYARLERMGDRLAAGARSLLADRRIAAHVTGLGSKGSVSYGSEPVLDHASYRRRHDPRLAELIWTFAMNRGVYTTPGREQEWNLSVAHGEPELARYLEVFEELADELTRRRSGSARA